MGAVALTIEKRAIVAQPNSPRISAILEGGWKLGWLAHRVRFSENKQSHPEAGRLNERGRERGGEPHFLPAIFMNVTPTTYYKGVRGRE